MTVRPVTSVSRFWATSNAKMLFFTENTSVFSGATRKILSKPDIKAKFEATSAELEPSTPDEFRIFIARQLDSWGKRVRDAGIQPE